MGKEANVFTARTKENTLVIVKIYRVARCDFNQMYSIIRSDPRYINLHKNKRKVIYAWGQREYKNLLKARELGVRVPTPYAVQNNVLVMEYIGKEEPAPKLKDLPPKNIKKFFATVVKNMKKLNNAKLVHGDLSSFNILNFNDDPVFIDLSQVTSSDNPNFDEYFDRDTRNMARYFTKNGYKITQGELKQLIRKS